MLKLSEPISSTIYFDVLFLLEAPLRFTLALSVLKSFLGGKVQQYGVLLLQIYDMQL